MLPWLLIIFISVPIAEIGVFIEVGDRFGLWPTIAAIFATAIAGTALIRYQGLNIIRDLQAQLDAGRLPARQIFDGLCLLIAGALLLTPGFITDTIGFILLVPLFRRYAAGAVLSRVARHHDFHAAARPAGGSPGSGAGGSPGSGAGGVVIDGEFAEVGETDGDPGGAAAPRLPAQSDPDNDKA